MCGARVGLCFGWPAMESASLKESTNQASSTELADLLITLSDVPSLTDRAAFQCLLPLPPLLLSFQSACSMNLNI